MKKNRTGLTRYNNRHTHIAGLTAFLALFLALNSCSKDDTVVDPNVQVIPVQSTVQTAVNLQSTSGFVILAGSLISNVPTSAVTGDVGLSPAARSNITGFGLTEVTGTIYAADDTSPVPEMLTA
ncbi:MAG: ice-binding family protein, partial [Bacteroidota bacterium]